MTFDASEISATAGEPVELYRFAYASTVLRYTSSDRDLTFSDPSPSLYARSEIERGTPTQSGENKPSELELTLRRDHPIALKYRVFVPPASVSITIYRVHRGDLAASIVFWKGLIRSVAWDGNFARVACEAIDSILKVDGMRFQYQTTCNHMLFGSGCNLANGPFVRTGVITNISGADITCPIFGAEASGWFAGGVIEAGGDRRMILRTVGNVATVLLPFESAYVGQTITALPGCPRSAAICTSKFGNIAHFGGFPQLPVSNPFDVGIEGQTGGYFADTIFVLP